MKNLNNLRRKLAAALGIGAAAAVGCSVCCLPLVAPVLLSGLASAGIYRYGDVPGTWRAGLAAAAALSILVFWIVRRRRLRAGAGAPSKGCDCTASCQQ